MTLSRPSSGFVANLIARFFELKIELKVKTLDYAIGEWTDPRFSCEIFQQFWAKNKERGEQLSFRWNVVKFVEEEKWKNEDGKNQNFVEWKTGGLCSELKSSS